MAFEKGQSGNPGGRPLGPKSTLKVRLIDALAEDFENNGKTAIETVRKENPVKYLEIICAVIPKDVNVKGELDVTHVHLSVSETDSLVAEALGTGEDRALPEPVLN
jgi:hypothetical protein